MRTVLPVTGSAIMLTVLMVSSSDALAQSGSLAQDGDLWNPDSLPNCIVTRVRNAPFQQRP